MIRNLINLKVSFFIIIMYTNAEKNDMLFCYYYKNRDPQAAADLYYERYMERRRLFINLEKNLSLHGCFKKPK